MSELLRSLAAVLVAAVLVCPAGAEEKDKDRKEKAKEEAIDPDKLPVKVQQVLKAKFPRAKITKVTKEKEGDDVVYDIEFTVDGKKTEADVKENGTLVNWEQEIPVKDLPKAVTDAIAKKYPKSKLEEAMKITEVQDKKDVPGGYEVIVITEDKKEIEVEVTEDGKIKKAE